MITINDYEKLLGKSKISGSQARFRKCPLCGRVKNLNPCFSVNLENNSFYCFYTGKGGILKKSVKVLTIETFNNSLKECSSKTYKDFKEKSNYKDPIDLQWEILLKIKEKCLSFNSLSEKNLEYLKSRGISKSSTKGIMMELDGKMAIPVTNGDYPIGIKYRTRDKIITAEKGSEFNYFLNWQNIRDFSTIYIVEGEIDLLTMIELGYSNVISFPAGANNLKCMYNQRDFLVCFSEIVLMVDSDEAGEKCKDKMLKFFRVLVREDDFPIKVYTVDYQGEKDINDVYSKQGEVAARKVIEEKIEYLIKKRVGYIPY